MTRQLPAGMKVRYDYHEHPRGISAIVMTDSGEVKAVGVAKYNPEDEAFSMALGEKVSLQRALFHLDEIVPRGNASLNLVYPVIIHPDGQVDYLHEPKSPGQTAGDWFPSW